MPTPTTPPPTPPPAPLGLAPTFGFGDRLGTATPGHLQALREHGGEIRGLFAQQSIREMARTQRTPDEVMRAAVETLEAERFGDPWGADADHLKTEKGCGRDRGGGVHVLYHRPVRARRRGGG